MKNVTGKLLNLLVTVVLTVMSVLGLGACSDTVSKSAYEYGQAIQYCNLVYESITSDGKGYYCYYEENEPVIRGICNSFSYSGYENGTAVIEEYVGKDAYIDIPFKINGYYVFMLAKNCFDSKLWIKSVIVPDTVQIIDTYAFINCRLLDDVVLSENLKVLKGGFRNCNSLESIELPDSLRYIESAFNGCSGLKEIKLPKELKEISGSMFSGCRNLLGIEFLCEEAKIQTTSFFENCVKIESANLPEGTEWIGESCYYGCKNLTEIILPSTIEQIRDLAFAECNRLIAVNIPDGVTSIGRFAFRNCKRLENIYIPASVTRIDHGAFSGCNNLTITTEEGSFADIAAKENGIPVKYR
ncbi:MAG: leucine-rich repeat protein [Clostridia bacterium]|nr:leucine-rich repeat protein [Clostridia bacterium]